MPCTVVSLTGRICTTFMPARSTSSTSASRSPKSPAPTLRVLRSENTGTAIPLPRHGAGNRKCPSRATMREGRAPGPRHAFEGLGSEAGGDEGAVPDAGASDELRSSERRAAPGCSANEEGGSGTIPEP